jgi:hypothetical protein
MRGINSAVGKAGSTLAHGLTAFARSSNARKLVVILATDGSSATAATAIVFDGEGMNNSCEVVYEVWRCLPVYELAAQQLR